MYILDFFYIWKTNRMTLFCKLFIERPSYLLDYIKNITILALWQCGYSYAMNQYDTASKHKL